MIERPRFKPHFHVEIVKPDQVYLFSEKNSFVLSGRLYGLLAPWLDGRHTVDEIVAGLQGEASFLGIYRALLLLAEKGYITENNENLPEEVAAFWSQLGVAPPEAGTSGVSIVTYGKAQADPFIGALASLDIPVTASGSLSLVLTDDYLQPELEDFNREALRANRPWLLATSFAAAMMLSAATPLSCSANSGVNWAYSSRINLSKLSKVMSHSGRKACSDSFQLTQRRT